MTDSAERWRRVQALVESMESLAPADRLAQLMAAEPDPAVRQEALDLLDALEAEVRSQHLHRQTAAAARDSAGQAGELPTAIGGVRIEASLGAGGSGEVFRGVRTMNGTPQKVAVKRFHTHRATADDLARFGREQEVLARLTHPAIVRFFDAGTTADGRPYLVMELVEGESIIEYSDARALTLPARLRLFLRVCEAVQSAHEHGVLHLDLKPSNIIVAGEPGAAYVKLVDFGTAKLAKPDYSATRTEPLTVRYASPERLRGDAVSAACDVYSLGLILFELVSGGWPFRLPESIVAVAERASGAAVPAPLRSAVTAESAARRSTTADRLQTVISGSLDAIVTRATMPDPMSRYGSVADLAADLRRYLDGEQIMSRAMPAGRPARRGMGRYAWILATIALAAASVAALSYRDRPGTTSAPSAGARPSVARGDARTSQRTPNLSQGTQMFDDFVFADRTVITGATWQGIYCSPTAGTLPPPAATATGFLVGFYRDRDGLPLRAAARHATYPIERVEQRLETEWQARCGGPSPTSWAHYHYAVTFDEPFVAEPGVRYWFSVQAQTNEVRGDPAFAFWGWLSGPPVNGRSVQLTEQAGVTTFDTDRAFTLR